MLINGDSLIELKRFEDNSIDALVTDPPAGIAFMGKQWDTKDTFQIQMRAIFEETLRVLKPGAHGLVWALPRTSHWTASALEEAGFEIRDVCTHVFATGFPKSHNIGNGWGSALKPASEHWILVRKPLEKGLTIAQNVLKYGTGAINIDASRIGHSEDLSGLQGNPYLHKLNTQRNGETEEEWLARGRNNPAQQAALKKLQQLGRFPANFMLSHHPECEEVGTREEDISINGQGNDNLFHGGFDPSSNFSGRENKAITPIFKCHPECPVAELDRQSEGSSRFFYTSKPSKAERDAGCDELEEQEIVQFQTGNGASGKPSSISEGRDTRRRNIHPTVKPTKLMRYLIQMICPPGGTVLDPFAGSCTTGVAAIQTKRQPILIEREAEYVEIGEARMAEAGGENEEQNRLFI